MQPWRLVYQSGDTYWVSIIYRAWCKVQRLWMRQGVTPAHQGITVPGDYPHGNTLRKGAAGDGNKAFPGVTLSCSLRAQKAIWWKILTQDHNRGWHQVDKSVHVTRVTETMTPSFILSSLTSFLSQLVSASSHLACSWAACSAERIQEHVTQSHFCFLLRQLRSVKEST